MDGQDFYTAGGHSRISQTSGTVSGILVRSSSTLDKVLENGDEGVAFLVSVLLYQDHKGLHHPTRHQRRRPQRTQPLLGVPRHDATSKGPILHLSSSIHVSTPPSS